MKRNRFRGALAALAIGALALTCLPTETTTAAFTASADAPGGAVTTATATLPPLSGVQALHDSAGGVILSWDENAFSGDPDRYVIERTVNGVTTLVDGGDGMVREHSAAPPLTTSRAVITQLSAQIYNTCGLAAGDVYCWGNALDEFQPRRIPTRVGGVLADLTVSKVSLGHFFACAIAEGEAYCWGRGMQGQLGHGVFSGSVLPVKVGGALAGKTVTDIAAGREYACAIADARAYCWGGRSRRQPGGWLHPQARVSGRRGWRTGGCRRHPHLGGRLDVRDRRRRRVLLGRQLLRHCGQRQGRRRPRRTPPERGLPLRRAQVGAAVHRDRRGRDAHLRHRRRQRVLLGKQCPRAVG